MMCNSTRAHVKKSDSLKQRRHASSSYFLDRQVTLGFSLFLLNVSPLQARETGMDQPMFPSTIPWILVFLALGGLIYFWRRTRKLAGHLETCQARLAGRQQQPTLLDGEIQTYIERLTTAQDIACMGFFDWDILSNKADSNEHFQNIFGIEDSQERISEERWLSCIHPSDRARARNEVRDTLVNNAPYDTQYRIIRPDGSVRWIASKAKVLYNSSGQPYRMIGAVTDITDQMLARQSQKKINERIAEEQRKSLAESERSRLALLGILEDQKLVEEELSRHRDNLEELVQERTRTLRERTAELERFNNAMIGREKRIIELKVAINQLHMELGRELPYPQWTGREPDE